MKKLPRIDVIEKQLAVAMDELSPAEAATVQGGAKPSCGQQLTPMYGAPRPVQDRPDNKPSWFNPTSLAPKKASSF